MDKTLKIKISVDKDTGAISVIGKEFDGLSDKVKKTDGSVSTFGTNLKTLAAGAVSIYALKEAFGAVAHSGFEFNKSMEESIAGLSALTVATSQNTSTFGNHLTITRKYELAQQEAIKTAEALNAINAETPHTLKETTQIYKAMYVSMKNAGASNEDMIRLTKQLSIAAGAQGVEFNSLLAGVDGLATGTVEIASDFGRFAGSLGLTNKELKASKNVVELLDDKLKGFKSFDTMEVATSNFENAWSKLSGTLTKDIFEIAKEGIKNLTGLLDGITVRVETIQKQTQKRSEFALIGEIQAASQIADELNRKMVVSQKGGFGAGNLEAITKEAQAAKDKLDALSTSYVKLYGETAKDKENLIPKKEIKEDEELIKLKKKYYEEIKKMDDKSHLYFLDNQAKEALETYQHYEALKEEYKTVAGARDKLTTLQNQELKNIETKQLAELNEEKLKLQKKFVDEANALVEKKNAFYLEGLTKEALETYNHYNSLIEEYKSVAGAEEALRVMQNEAMDDIIAKQKKLDAQLSNKSALDSLDEIYGRYQNLIDAQIELAENGMNIDFDFGDGAKELNNISKAMQQLHVGSLKATKQDMKLQEDFAKNFLEAKGDETAEKEAMANYEADAAKLKKTQLNAEMAGYASLAGAMAGAFEQGSAGAIAFTALQSALGIASSWTAIANAWALTFPANIPAAAMVAANVMPIISQLGGSSGSSGGGVSSISSTGQTYEQNRTNIEAEYKPITDRLDRQIELLERLNLKGSASLAGITRADSGFGRDYALFIEDTFEAVRKSFDLRVIERQGFSAQAFVDEMERIDDVINGELFTSQNVAMAQQMSDAAKGFINEDVLREGNNLLIFLAEASRSIYGQMALVDDIHANWGANIQETETYFANTLNEIFEITAEYANSMLDVMDELKDASQSMKEAYDNLTGSMRYETERLTTAFEDFDRLRGTTSYADYLQNQITAIDELGTELNTDLIDLLMSEDPTRLQEQVAAIESLGEMAGRVFEGGAEEALNYLESIELVAESMARSRENIKSFTDSQLTDEQLAQNLASSIGVALATSTEELTTLFFNLSGGVGGLTDAELDLLNANKDLLNARIEEATAIRKMTVDNLKTFSDSLRTTEQRTQALADTLGVDLADSYEELGSLAERLATDTDGLTDSELNLLNANKDLIATNLDMTKSISTLDGALGTIASTIEKLRASSRTSEQNLQIYYDAMDEAQRLSTTNLYEDYANAIKKASDASSVLFNISAFQADPNMDMQSAQRDMQFAQLVAANQFESLQDVTLTEVDYLKQIEENTRNQIEALIVAMDSIGNSINQALLASTANTSAAFLPLTSNRVTLADGRTAVISQDGSGTKLTFNSGATHHVAGADSLSLLREAYGFRSGGYTGDMGVNDIAGFVHGQEYVVNAQTTRDLGLNNSVGIFNAILTELAALRNEVKVLRQESNKNQVQISKNTAASRYAS